MTVSSHVHRFSEQTLDPDFRRCAHGLCSQIMRVVVPKPAPAIQGSATSEAAAATIEWERKHFRQRVWDAHLAAGETGLTDEEGIAATGINPSTYRPRRIELREAGLLIDSKRTRPSKSRRAMTVWVRRE